MTINFSGGVGKHRGEGGVWVSSGAAVPTGYMQVPGRVSL